MKNSLIVILLGLFTIGTFATCKKLVNIAPPVGDLVASQVFANDIQATSAASGMFSQMINTPPGFASCGISLFSGMSADELVFFNQAAVPFMQFQINALTTTNNLVSGAIWYQAYQTIYQANSIIAGLTTISGVHDSVKNELIGESEFVRAFCYFYLVNLFGDIPLVTSINYTKNGTLPRAPVSEIYKSIIGDLKDAQMRLLSDYSVGAGQRILPNKWAATALLARVYLFTSDWQNAFSQASSLINNTSIFGLCADPTLTFLANSTEAIWQLQQNNTTDPWYNITPEANLIIPATLNSDYNPPYICLTPTLLNSFEAGDLRRVNWVDSTAYQGSEYYFPFKYHDGPSAIQPNTSCREYYMVLRLAEQYLIRAEAEAQLEQTSTAIIDLNAIRSRAGLPEYKGPTDKGSVLQAIYHERQVEFFAEWGNRWLDLKRTSRATQILSQTKGFTVTNDMLLYPIPVEDLTVDPNLTQNPGY